MREKRIKPYSFRMPEKIKTFVAKRAEENKRSINSELNMLLEMAINHIKKQEFVSNERQ